jgi:hypothetical protein
MACEVKKWSAESEARLYSFYDGDKVFNDTLGSMDDHVTAVFIETEYESAVLRVAEIPCHTEEKPEKDDFQKRFFQPILIMYILILGSVILLLLLPSITLVREKVEPKSKFYTFFENEEEEESKNSERYQKPTTVSMNTEKPLSEWEAIRLFTWKRGGGGIRGPKEKK